MMPLTGPDHFHIAGPFNEGSLFGNHGVNDRLFAFQTTNTGAGAAVDYPLQAIVIAVDAMQLEHRAFIRVAWIG